MPLTEAIIVLSGSSAFNIFGQMFCFWYCSILTISFLALMELCKVCLRASPRIFFELLQRYVLRERLFVWTMGSIVCQNWLKSLMDAASKNYSTMSQTREHFFFFCGRVGYWFQLRISRRTENTAKQFIDEQGRLIFLFMKKPLGTWMVKAKERKAISITCYHTILGQAWYCFRIKLDWRRHFHFSMPVDIGTFATSGETFSIRTALQIEPNGKLYFNSENRSWKIRSCKVRFRVDCIAVLRHTQFRKSFNGLCTTSCKRTWKCPHILKKTSRVIRITILTCSLQCQDARLQDANSL